MEIWNELRTMKEGIEGKEKWELKEDEVELYVNKDKIKKERE